MLHIASGKGSYPESPPPPPQQNDEPKSTTTIDDEHENLEIPSEIKLESATGIQLVMEENDHINHQSDNSSADDFVKISKRKRRKSFSRKQMSKIGQRRRFTSRNLEEIVMRGLQKQQEIYNLIENPKKKLRRERQKAREIYRGALHNTRDTTTLVATLIATFTYAAGVNPPGGVYQDGPLIGTAVAARKTAFRVFSVCNNVALFTSICVVLVLVNIIPFTRKALMGMLATANKVIWVAVSFMTAAYVAAAVVINQPPPPLRTGMDWTTVFLLSISAGSLGTIFVGLGIMLVRHRMLKEKWRKENPRRRKRRQEREKSGEDFYDGNDLSPTYSDMDASDEIGYQPY